jgi:hypothetical protein
MEMSNQVRPRYALERMLGGPLSLSGLGGEEKETLPRLCRELNHDCLAHILVIVLTELTKVAIWYGPCPLTAWHEDVLRRILNLGTRWKWVVNFTIPPPLHPLDKRLGGSQSRYGCCDKEEIPDIFGNRTPVVLPATNHYTVLYILQGTTKLTNNQTRIPTP